MAVAGPPPQEPARWETCRIGHSSGWGARWIATVTTPDTTYFVEDPLRRGISIGRRGPNGRDSTTWDSHTALVDRLAREGWEPVPCGGQWWERDFRRQAVPLSHEHCEIVLRNRWVADAIGTGGQYDAAASARLRGMSLRAKLDHGRAALEELLGTLRTEHWEDAGTYGSGWWQLRFRRLLPGGH